VALDPVIAAALDAMAAAGLPPMSSLEPAALRAQAAAMPPVGRDLPMASVQDRAVPGPEGPIPVRVYDPTGDAGAPVVVFLHGGGFVMGSLDGHDPVCRELATRVGCIVVSVDYRLAPEHPYPAGLDDATAVVRWVRAHAADVGGDPARVAVAGDSSGGNFAAAVSLRLLEAGEPVPLHQVLVYPVIDHAFDTASYERFADGFFLSRDDMRWFWGHYLADDADGARPDVSVLHAPSLAGLPPTTIVLADHDPLRDEGAAFGVWLEAAGVDVLVHEEPGTVHGYLNVFGPIPPAERSWEVIARRLRGALGT
jgi:acetyl esterase